jgi:predicted nucleic-acid-binding Zn-ribbon protein
MRASQKCPKCGGRQFYAVGACTVPAHDSINGTHPLTVAAAYLPTGQKGFLGMEGSKRFLASLQAWVCAACGYTEFYVNQPDVLAYMVKHGAADVRWVDAGVSGREPFR